MQVTVAAPAPNQFTIYVPGPQGPKGDKGDTGTAAVDAVQTWTKAHTFAPDADFTPVTIKSNASQTQPLLRWTNSAGTLLSHIDINGTFYAPNGAVNVASATVRGGASFAGNVTNSAGTLSSPLIFAGSEHISGYQMGVVSGATTVGLLVRGAVSQTADLTQWQNSAGTVLARVNSTGGFESLGQSFGIYDAARNFPSFVLSGQKVDVGYSGYNPLLTLNPDGVGEPGAGVSLFRGGHSGRPVLVVRPGASATDLQQWQDSAGTVLARVFAGGSFITTGVAEVQGAYLASNVIRSYNSPSIEFKSPDDVTRMLVRADQIGFAIPIRSMGQNPAGIPLTVKGEALQTGDLTQWQNSAGTVLASIGSNGALKLPANVWHVDGGNVSRIHYEGAGPTYFQGGAAAAPSIAVRGLASQTGDLQQWQNSATTVVAKVTYDGTFRGNRVQSNNVLMAGLNTYQQHFVDIASNEWDTTTTGAFVLNTPIGRAHSRMSRIRIWGYDYQRAAIVDFTVVLYPYGGANGPDAVAGQLTNYKMVDNGTDGLNKYLGVNASGNIAIALGDTNSPGYYTRLSAEAWITQAGHTVGYESGWSFTGPVTTANFGFAYAPIDLGTNSAGPSNVVTISGTQTITGAKRFDAVTTLNGGASSSALALGNFTAPNGSVAVIQAQPQAATYVGQIVRGFTSQTADLAQWQDSAGTVLTRVTSAGRITTNVALHGDVIEVGGAGNMGGHLNVTITNAANRGVTVRAAASQTANIQEWQNSAGVLLAKVDSAGRFYEDSTRVIGAFGQHDYHSAYGTTGFDGPSDFGSRFIQSAVAGPGIAGATQYYNFALGLGSEYPYSQFAMQWAVPRVSQGGNPYLTFRYREAGAWGGWHKVYAGYADTAGSATPSNDADLVHKSGAETITGAKTFSIGVRAASPAANVADSASYAFMVGAAGAERLTLGYDATRAFLQSWSSLPLHINNQGNLTLIDGGLRVKTYGAANVPMTVVGDVSQTGDLMRWQDSAGTVVSKVSAGGDITVGPGGAGLLAAQYLVYGGNTGPFFHLTGGGANGGIRVLNRGNGPFPALVVQGETGQAGDLQQWRNDTGAVLSSINAAGNMRVNLAALGRSGTGYPVFGDNITFTSTNSSYLYDRGDTALMVDTNSGNFIVRSAPVGVAGTEIPWQAMLHIAQASKTATFYGNIVTSAGGAFTGSVGIGPGVETGVNAELAVRPYAAGVPGIIVRGFTAQTNDLQQWQDSAGNILAKVASDGTIYKGGQVVGGNAADTEIMAIMGAF